MVEARDFLALTRARPAGLHTILHVPQRGAILFAGLTDLGAEFRQLGMELALAAQRIGGEGAKAGAIQHQPQMLRPGMLSAHLQAMRHGHG